MELLDSILILMLCVLWWIHEVRLDRYKKRIQNLETLNAIMVDKGIGYVRETFAKSIASVGQELASRERDSDTT